MGPSIRLNFDNHPNHLVAPRKAQLHENSKRSGSADAPHRDGVTDQKRKRRQVPSTSRWWVVTAPSSAV
ncbi:hypothetical protein M3J09_013790 [Ascochyta lentis]